MNVCRICLSEAVEKDITQLPDEIKGNKESYWDIMLFCLNIQVSPQSKLTKLCIKCFVNIITFHKFKTLALKNDAYLQHIQTQENYKCEVSDTDHIKSEVMSNGQFEDGINDIDGIENIELEIKKEDNIEVHSEDELLSVIKKIKYEYIIESGEESVDTSTKAERKRAKFKKKKQGIERREKICEECGKTVINLKEHMMLHKPAAARKRYKCKACDKTFANCSARYKHHKIKHLGIKQHCDECGKDVICLRSHRLVIHYNETLPFECVPCGRRFISQAKKDMHMLSHTKDRPFPCDQCDKTFRNKVGLLQHKRQVHEKEKSHLCQVCSKRFFKKYHLQVHLRSHSKEKPYECPDCGKYFSSCTVLKNHRLIHSDVKNYVCDLCDMAFRKPGYLRNHMICHTKEKRYSCKYCDMPFGRSDHRLRHERTAHERHLLPAA